MRDQAFTRFTIDAQICLFAVATDDLGTAGSPLAFVLDAPGRLSERFQVALDWLDLDIRTA